MPSDEGIVWFADAGAERKTVSLLDRFRDGAVGASSESRADSDDDDDDDDDEDDGDETLCDVLKPIKLDSSTASVLDIGTGNGHMLYSLRQAGWKGRMVGIDYSRASVDLAKQIALARVNKSGTRRDPSTGLLTPESELESIPTTAGCVGFSNIEFHYFDVLTMSPLEAEWFSCPDGDTGAGAAGFDVVHDKGTFDAISLCAETDEHGNRIGDGYPARIVPLIKVGGLFVITSCNWTEAELVEWFVRRSQGQGGPTLELVGRVRYRSFSYGGSTGQKVTTVCFERVC